MSELFNTIGSQARVEHVSVAHSWYSCGNLDPYKGRRNNVVLILSVALMPVFVTVIQNIVSVYSNSLYVNHIMDLRSKILLSTEMGNIVHRTQIERGKTALYMSSGGDSGLFDELKEAWDKTDAAILSFSQWPEEDNPRFANRTVFHDRIKAFRSGINFSTTKIDDVIDFYSKDNTVMLKWVANSVQNYRSGSLWKTLVSYHMLVLSKEHTGIVRAIGGSYFARDGVLDSNELLRYMLTNTKAETYLKRCAEYDDLAMKAINDNFNGTQLDQTIKEMRTRIAQNTAIQPSTEQGTLWFNNMTVFIDILRGIELSLERKILDTLNEERSELEEGLKRMIIIMVFAVLLTPFVFVCIYRLTHRMQHFATSLSEKTQDLDKERKRSQTILYELLPIPVAKKMINREPIEPEAYSNTTIFFSDIVGFTDISSRSTPMQVVTMLNTLYQAFDNNLEMYDVYKVETIGDAYMVASGLPVRNGDRHASEIANLALDLLDTISGLRIPHNPEQTLRLRIGLNSGPVVAGVVGHKMPRYCLFGDTVNTASRMESSSIAHHIQITKSTHSFLMHQGGFIITPRGEIEVKGKGIMTTYWLEGREGMPEHTLSNVVM